MQTFKQLSRRFFLEQKRRFASLCKEDRLPLKRVLILKKRTRYELEKLNYAEISDEEFNKFLRDRGSNVNAFLETYELHEKLSRKLKLAFQNAGFEVDVVDRPRYTAEAVDWADLVVTAGGDGTFLVGAAEIKTRDKPVMGFNTNPQRSSGYLCIPCSFNYEMVVKRLKKYEFQWKFRTRIEVKLTGHFLTDSPELIGMSQVSGNSQQSPAGYCPPLTSQVLPSKALNEVFLSERLPCQVTNLIINVPGVPKTHIKCSGMCVSTGTGSTSWHMSMNRITFSEVQRLFRLAKVNYSMEKLQQLTTDFNDSLQFPYDDPRMFYTAKDLIHSPITPDPSGFPEAAFTQSISIASKCYAADVVIDGTHAWPFNDGTVADLSTKPEIALRTVHLP